MIHNHGNTAHLEAISLRHHALPKPIRHMVRAQERRDHNEDVDRHKRKRDREPARQRHALEIEVRLLAPGEHAARVTRLRDRGLDERGEVPAARELVLHARTAGDAERAGPLCVELTAEVECLPAVTGVPRCDEEGEDEPEGEGVDGEERAVVEDYAGPAEERGEDAGGGGDGGDYELGAVADADYVGVVPNVEPGEQAEDERDERVACQLWNGQMVVILEE
ncbi:hypothetical protein C0993_004654 [Termitomyces sp. T159_Od127]|nr:hypothetical protein C0993_004654 [Termitomyces sp. T159_Od127]